MKTEQLYRKVEINSIDDLPKDDGFYFVHIRGISNAEDGIDVFGFNKSEDIEDWIGSFDWYLIPSPEKVSDLSDELVLEIIKDESEKSDVRKCTCINGFGYSQFERNIATRVIDLFRKSIVNASIPTCEHNYVYKIMHDHTAADVCTKCGNIKLQSIPTREMPSEKELDALKEKKK